MLLRLKDIKIMKVEIEIEDKYVSAIAAQCVLAADSEYEETIVEEARKKCQSETIVLNPEAMGDDSKQLQLAIAMIAMAQVTEEVENNMN